MRLQKVWICGFGFYATREWMPFHHRGETVRGGIFSQNGILIGSSLGFLYEKNIETLQEVSYQYPAMPSLEILDGNRRMVLGRSVARSLLLNGSTLAIKRDFVWSNMTMFEGIMGARYLRLSSDHWLTIADGDDDNEPVFAHRLNLSVSSMVVSGKIMNHHLFLLTMDRRLIMLNMKNISHIEESVMDFPLMHATGGHPVSMDIIDGITPINYRVAVLMTTPSHARIYDLDTFLKKMIHRAILPRSSLRRVKWVDMDSLVLVRSRHLELYHLSVGTTDRMPLSFGDFVSTICFRSPYLLLDGGRGLHITRMIQE